MISPQLGFAVGWLKNSLEHRAQDLRQAERRCRKAAYKGPLLASAQRLADTYAKAAQVFESELAELEKETQ